MKINPDAHLKEKIKLIYPLRWLSDTPRLACRIIDYETISDELREKRKEEYLKMYQLNLQKLQQMWK